MSAINVVAVLAAMNSSGERRIKKANEATSLTLGLTLTPRQKMLVKGLLAGGITAGGGILGAGLGAGLGSAGGLAGTYIAGKEEDGKRHPFRNLVRGAGAGALIGGGVGLGTGLSRSLPWILKDAAELPQRKSAGYWSELGSNINPLNLVTAPVGALSALATPTRTLDEQAAHDFDSSQPMKNMLIPGVAGYNSAKRLGQVIRGPELKAMKQKIYKEKDLKKKLEAWKQQQEQQRSLAEMEAIIGPTKQSGFWTEEVGTQLNPLNMYGGALAGGAAALTTPTKSLRDLAENDTNNQRLWQDPLVPGVGPYNLMKRLGTSIRGPELLAKIDSLRAAKAEKDEKKRLELEQWMASHSNPDAAEKKASLAGLLGKLAALHRLY